ncbi:uncharacterized protein C8Q71DRAFT_79812, partial [Rhodofomes roseus]
MPRRSKASLMRGHPPQFLSSHHDSLRTACFTADPTDMDDKTSPHKGLARADPANSADKRQQSERDANTWKNQIYGRVVQPVEDDEINIFLREFVHSGVPMPQCPARKFPQEVPSGKGKEREMYKALLPGLATLVEGFKAAKRPKFINHAHKDMRFPFALGDDDNHVTKPDIVATIPARPYIPPADRWRNVALVFEIKARDADDPMVKYTAAHEKTLVQLAKSARNIMLSQGRLYAFVVGIYGHQARIFRFDRAGGVCSPQFNYMKKPYILHEFMWRFVHPATPGCVVVGDDPTIRLGSRADRALAQKWVADYDPSCTYTAENRKAVRRFTITNDKGVPTEYLVYKLIFVNPRLFSRATTIWEAFELLKGGKETTGKRVVIKDAWRQFARPSEIGIYMEMREAAEAAAEEAAAAAAEEATAAAAAEEATAAAAAEEATEAAAEEAAEAAAEDVASALINIAEFEYGQDLGLREAQSLVPPQERARSSASGTQGASAGPAAEKYFEDIPPLTVPYRRVLGQRTVTARCRDVEHEYNERSHTRLVMKTIGVPITQFESTYELVTALRDAILGHLQAYLAGIIHRDISQGNVMIARRPDGTIIGFIHDFDYAFSWRRFLERERKTASIEEWEKYAREGYKRAIQNLKVRLAARRRGKDRAEPKAEPAPDPRDPRNDHKQRTGTPHFMAIQVLDEHTRVPHEVHYDLESFYWLLVWIILRHTTYSHLDDEDAWHRLFDATLYQGRALKKEWLSNEDTVYIESNEPLTNLLDGFRVLCKRSNDNPDMRLTHEEVLGLFDEALADRDAWPRNDRARPWVPPKFDPNEQLPGMEVPSGQKRGKGTLTYTSEQPVIDLPRGNGDEEDGDDDQDVENHVDGQSAETESEEDEGDEDEEEEEA